MYRIKYYWTIQYIYFSQIIHDFEIMLDFTHVTHPLINGHVENRQRDKREHVVHEEIHPMDVQGDIILIASQFGRKDAVHCDIVLPMPLVIHCDFPESKSNV